MGDRRTTGEKIFAVFNTIFLVILAVVFILPVWHVAMSSISDPDVLQANSQLALKPLGEATLGGFKFVLDNPNILRDMETPSSTWRGPPSSRWRSPSWRPMGFRARTSFSVSRCFSC